MNVLNKDHHAILGALNVKGVATSLELQEITGKSQPTVSRLLGDLSSQVLTLGRGRATLYGLPKSIRGLPSQQPVFLVNEDGVSMPIGMLSFLAGDIVHVESDLVSGVCAARLPWFLSPLRAQGFLGRLLAQRLAASGVDSNPDKWNIETALFAALHLYDAPGAIVVGDSHPRASVKSVPANPKDMAQAFDAMAADVAKTLPDGSSAGGEQPKFLVLLESGQHALVKFSPPRGTPFGDRWHDLLHAEALASSVLGCHGVDVAECGVVESDTRTYLVSKRFDRVGATGRRHVVSIGAAHDAFVAGSYSNWAVTCEALVKHGRLESGAAIQAQALLDFGRLIGNSDMHSGNLGLIVTTEGLARGRFKLAPIYDMLPMRWRPDPMLGCAADYAAFEPSIENASSPASAVARVFWTQLSTHTSVSQALRAVASEMVNRLVPESIGKPR